MSFHWHSIGVIRDQFNLQRDQVQSFLILYLPVLQTGKRKIALSVFALNINQIKCLTQTHIICGLQKVGICIGIESIVFNAELQEAKMLSAIHLRY